MSYPNDNRNLMQLWLAVYFYYRYGTLYKLKPPLGLNPYMNNPWYRVLWYRWRYLCWIPESKLYDYSGLPMEWMQWYRSDARPHRMKK